MGNSRKTLAVVFSTSLLALSACTYNDGTANRPATGILLGAATGAAAGQILGGDTRSAAVGGAIGAAVGGVVGTQMEAQERELRRSLAGTGADIRNDGTQLRVTLPESVTFPTASSVVAPGFRPALRSVSQSLQRYPNASVRVVGHTDNVGAAAFNNQLSQDRALAVARELIGNGTPAGRISVSGRGFYEPIASNASAQGRAENRRVEIVITPNN